LGRLDFDPRRSTETLAPRGSVQHHDVKFGSVDEVLCDRSGQGFDPPVLGVMRHHYHLHTVVVRLAVVTRRIITVRAFSH